MGITPSVSGEWEAPRGAGRVVALAMSPLHTPSCPQELRPRGLDVKQEELGDLVDKEMAATSAAIETAAARIEVSCAAGSTPQGHPVPPARGWAWQPGTAGSSAQLCFSCRRC